MSFEGTIESFPEFKRPRELLLARAKQLEWYHTLQLDEAFTTPGYFKLDEYAPYYMMPDSLEGLECLEVGAANGYWSFLMEKRKAQSITATDLRDYSETDRSKFHGVPDEYEVPAIEGFFGEHFRLAATLLESQVRYKLVNVYDLSPESVGLFDFVFCGSMLMHLYGPHLALQRMSSVCKNALVITSQTEVALDGESTAQFTGKDIPIVHFVPSPTCLINMLTCCGYEKVLRGPTFHLAYRDADRNPYNHCHTSAIALKDAANPCIDLPAPRKYSDAEKRVELEIVSCPPKARVNESFDVLVRYRNGSNVAWRGDEDKMRIYSGYDLDPAARKRLSLSGTGAQTHRAGVFPDLLPSGLSTLVRLQVKAPSEPGRVRIKPTLWQEHQRFSSEGAVAEVSVK